MLIEGVGTQDEMYVAFQEKTLSYVIPESDVGQITADVPEDIPKIYLAGCSGKDTCAIIFQDASGLLALPVEKVTGIIRISAECQYELPLEARSPRNEWIAGVAFLENTGSLSYLLDVRKLREYFCRERDDG